MLVVSRHANEKIRLGTEIEVTVVAIRGDKVLIGVDAPPQMPITRNELYERMIETIGKPVSLAGKRKAAQQQFNPKGLSDDSDHGSSRGDDQAAFE